MDRKSHSFKLALFAVLSGICLNFVQGQQQGYRPEVGSQHFDFTLPRIDNRQPLSLSDYRGKKILLLHFASW